MERRERKAEKVKIHPDTVVLSQSFLKLSMLLYLKGQRQCMRSEGSVLANFVFFEPLFE
jgi:hypothetical protein